jgi:hypothetical protein
MAKKTTSKTAAPKTSRRAKPAKKSSTTRRGILANSRGEPAGGAAQRLLPGPGELIVRMYRQGLGDCFLLAFGTDHPERPRYVLIDCGVHSRQTDGPKRLLQVMNDLAAATGKQLDVVVATHEHADHLSGFVQKGSPFLRDDLEIDELWVGWTERRGDRQADDLRKKRGSAGKVIEKAVEKARQRAESGLAEQLLLLTDFERPAEGSIDREAAKKAIRDLATRSLDQKAVFASVTREFFADSGAELGAAKGTRKEPSSNELALGLLAVKARQTTYCEPGMTPPLSIPGVPAARVYVLGPPRNEKLLHKDQPAKVRGSSSENGHDGKYQEVYLSGGANTRAFQLSPALGAAAELGETNQLPDDQRYPFAKTFYRPFPDPWSEPQSASEKKLPLDAVQKFYAEHYLDQRPKEAGSDERVETSWRRIDADWLDAAEQLALNLDSDTNNTSLVLAFEWGPIGSGQVLLFPGDAQVGNWLSWRDQRYRSGGKSFTADDLLSRTILYKVGHHASHNATVRCDPRETSVDHDQGVPFGLELMENIVALIPVDRDAADKKMPTPWEMPHRPLYERLREKAQRRVLRSDLRLTPLKQGKDDPDVVPDSTDWRRVPGLKGLKWRRSAEDFAAGTPGPLYYDLLFPLPKLG